jgi:hypothetical protein
MKHPHHLILQAIAEDASTEIEYQHPEGKWFPCDLVWLLGHIAGTYRIKSKPFLVNGVECPRPVKDSIRNTMTIIAYANSRRGMRKELHFAADADLMTVFNAVIKPFEEQGK